MKKLLTLALGVAFLFSCSEENTPENSNVSTPKTTDTTNNYYSPYDINAMVPVMVVVQNYSNAIFEFAPCFNMGYFDGNETDGNYFGYNISSYPNVFNLAGDEYRQQIYGNMETLQPGESRKYCNDSGNAGMPLVANPSYYTFSLPSAFSSTEQAIVQKFGKLFYLKYQFVDPITLTQYGGAYLRNDAPFTLGSSSYDPTQYNGMTTPSLYPFIKYYNTTSLEVFEDDYYANSVDSYLTDSGHILQFRTTAGYLHIEIF